MLIKGQKNSIIFNLGAAKLVARRNGALALLQGGYNPLGGANFYAIAWYKTAERAQEVLADIWESAARDVRFYEVPKE